MDAQFPIDRRGLVASIAALIGAASLPAEAFAARARRGARRFFTPAQFALLGAVADTIMPASDTPGALAANVPARIDGLMLNWASEKTRTDVVGALGRIDAAARAQRLKGFAALSPDERLALLRTHDIAALKSVPPPPNAPKSSPFAPLVSVADQGYYRIKDLVITLYYYSEAASTTELMYEHVPGKFEPSIKLTPQSRPQLGTGPF
jgi:gluconate 2-dehydrogenase gamma chain